MQRVILLVLAAIMLTACDSYIEEARVQPDGSIEFGALATVVCNDELQVAIWGDDPCPQIDTAIRTGDFGELPLDLDFDPNRVAVVGEGEQDRRELQARWSGQPEELSTLLVSGGEVRVLDEQRTEVIFRTNNTAFSRLQDSTDPVVMEALGRTRWDPAQFRIRVPDLVEEHNADRIQGRVVVWQIDNDLPEELRVVWTTEPPARHRWWWIVASITLLVVLLLMLKLEGPAAKRSTDGATSAPESAESESTESASNDSASPESETS